MLSKCTNSLYSSQYVYRLNEAKILDIPAATAQDFYDRFNYNHTLPYHYERKEEEKYVRFKVNVGRAVWNPISDEKHVDIPGIVYVGRRKLPQLLNADLFVGPS